jgi:hypothetical protein
VIVAPVGIFSAPAPPEKEPEIVKLPEESKEETKLIENSNLLTLILCEKNCLCPRHQALNPG